MDKLHYYQNTGLKFQLIHDLREEFEDEDVTNIESFNKGSIWEYGGYSDVSIPLGEGDFHGILLKKGNDYCCVGNSAKSIMRPLSSLTKDIINEMKSDLMMTWCDYYDEWVDHYYDLGKFVNFKQAPFEIAEWLISKHYWLFDQSEFGKSLIEIKE